MYNNEPEIICVFCGIGFDDLEQVEHHISVKHAGCQLPGDKNNGDMCLYKDEWEEENNMKKEKRTNTSLQIRHKCNWCFKHFYTKTSLLCHKQFQHGIIIRLKYNHIMYGGDGNNNKLKKRKYKNRINNGTKIQNARQWCMKCGVWFPWLHIMHIHQKKDCCEDNSSRRSSCNRKLCCQKCEMIFTNEKFCLIHKASGICQRNSTTSRSSHVSSEYSISHASLKDNSVGSHSNDESVDTSKSKKQVNNNSNKTESTKSGGSNKSKSNRGRKPGTGRYGRQFKCEVCLKNFSNRSSLSNHIKSHNSRRGTPFVCRECGTRFVNLLSLQDHRRNHQASGGCCGVAAGGGATSPDTTTIEDGGGLSSTTSSHLQSSTPLTPESSSNPTSSSTSYARPPPPNYSSLSNFNGVSQVPLWPSSRMGGQRSNSPQPVTCVHCSGIFYDRLELEEHAIAQHSTQKGDILCLLCERVFTTNMALRVHLTKSHGFANGGCPGVSQNLPPLPKFTGCYDAAGLGILSSKSRRKKRLLEHNPGLIEPKQFLCDVCNRYFATVQALANHRRACMQDATVNQSTKASSKPTPTRSTSSHSIESLIADNEPPTLQTPTPTPITTGPQVLPPTTPSSQTSTTTTAQQSSSSSSHRTSHKKQRAPSANIFPPQNNDDNNIFLAFN